MFNTITKNEDPGHFQCLRRMWGAVTSSRMHAQGRWATGACGRRPQELERRFSACWGPALESGTLSRLEQRDGGPFRCGEKAQPGVLKMACRWEAGLPRGLSRWAGPWCPERPAGHSPIDPELQAQPARGRAVAARVSSLFGRTRYEIPPFMAQKTGKSHSSLV